MGLVWANSAPAHTHTTQPVFQFITDIKTYGWTIFNVIFELLSFRAADTFC